MIENIYQLCNFVETCTTASCALLHQIR